MNNKILALAAILLLLFVGAVSVGCGEGDSVEASTDGSGEQKDAESKADGATGKDGADGDDEDEEEAVPVEVAALARGEIESVLRFSSNLEAESQVQVFSQAKRLVHELLVEEGDQVRKGRLLLRLQDDEQRSALAKVQSQLDKAEREYRRQKRLREQELISQQAFADAIFEMEQLEIARDDAERELSYTEVRAPIAGTVTSRMVNVGDQVQIGQELFEMIDFDSIVARIFVPEKHLPNLRPGLQARISTVAAESEDYAGSVDRIAPVVDPQSGTVKVTIAIGQQPGLRPGLYVDVDLVTATHPEALLVPKRAVVYDNDQMFVYRLGAERRVERVFVEALLSDKNFVEPVDGLEVGDEVVVAGQAGLKDGALVQLPGDQDRSEGLAETDDDALAEQRASL